MKTVQFFSRKHKLRGTICFLGGVVLIFLKWPVVGICVEVFGFINLFGDFFPVVLGFLRQLPFIGPVLRGPYIGAVRSSAQRSVDNLGTRSISWITAVACMNFAYNGTVLIDGYTNMYEHRSWKLTYLDRLPLCNRLLPDMNANIVLSPKSLVESLTKLNTP